MNLELTSDQALILEAIESLARPFEAARSGVHGFNQYSDDLEKLLIDGGFLDISADPELGPITAALVVERLARLPYCAEVAASMLIRPFVGADLPRPFCLADEIQMSRPIPFGPQAATLLIVGRSHVSTVELASGDITPVASLFAYPMGKIRDAERLSGRARACDVTASQARRLWQVALAVEAAGLLKGAIASTTGYVTDREQFGRPLGAFQAVRHRLAEASVRAEGVRWLALKAASTGDPGDAAIAALHAQESASLIVYDLHQFLGAMGVTLEHPLHLWTYRLKALLSQLGGRGAQAIEASHLLWKDDARPASSR